jgi:hypothetical protein
VLKRCYIGKKDAKKDGPLYSIKILMSDWLTATGSRAASCVCKLLGLSVVWG